MSAPPIRRLSPVSTGRKSAIYIRTKVDLKNRQRNLMLPLLNLKNLKVPIPDVTCFARKNSTTGSTTPKVRHLQKRTSKSQIFI
ncbi:ALTO [Scorpion polyomavirus 2]|nr:ALTO [Scorpion polyomavirus 2]QTH80129.1 ALTO [Scorpion polyomavirus 2]QTH80134.1 ALTO [Scorpion polyomavirus 2]